MNEKRLEYEARERAIRDHQVLFLLFTKRLGLERDEKKA